MQTHRPRNPYEHKTIYAGLNQSDGHTHTLADIHSLNSIVLRNINFPSTHTNALCCARLAPESEYPYTRMKHVAYKLHIVVHHNLRLAEAIGRTQIRAHIHPSGNCILQYTFVCALTNVLCCAPRTPAQDYSPIWNKPLSGVHGHK